MKRTITFLLPLVLVAGLLATFASPVAAQDDPPGRVARLNYIQGAVSFQPSGEKDWVEANPNRPLTTGDNLWADKDSRGEVHIGSTAIRLSSETGISIMNLDDRTAQIQLAQGTIEVHMRHLSGGDAFEIDTPNLAFTVTAAGEYRVAADPNENSTVITVRHGEGQVTGGGESYDLHSGQQYTFTGTDQLSYDAVEAPSNDVFDDWCDARDDRENHSESAHYVSRDVDGYYDLDDYGGWTDVPDYGRVWVPRGVPAGWAPYRYGHWVWIAPWGWTWVEDEPWGFAPFHYGRWIFAGGYWGWVPGPIVVRPVYAPHLVAFVGGGGFNLSVRAGSFAGVAWFPLGPRDVYVPGYHCSPRYVQNINITNTKVVNVTQVTNFYNTYNINNTRNVSVNRINYTYANNATAVTAVSRETFVNARPVGVSAVHITSEQIQNARPESTPLTHTRSSYVSTTAKQANAKPPIPFAQKPVVARLNPAASVNSRAPQVYTNDSKPFNQEPRGGNQPTPATNNQGFRPFGQPSGASNQAQAPHTKDGGQQSQSTTFQPPHGNNNPATTERNNTVNKPPVQPEVHPNPPMRFTPPVKARDEMYDVHPPVNNRPAPKQPEPKPEPKPKPQPAPKQDSHPHSEAHPHG